MYFPFLNNPVSTIFHPATDSMKTALNILIIAASVLAVVAPATAEESASHSLYKVTTYNLGTSLDFQDFSPIANQKKYAPLLITSTKADILDSDQLNDPRLETSTNRAETDGFAIAAKYSPTEKIALQGVVGVTKNTFDPSSAKRESSWEANLGVIYQMFKNLSYGVHFGYMDTGDLFKDRNTYKDVESIIMVSNQLTMSF